MSRSLLMNEVNRIGHIVTMTDGVVTGDGHILPADQDLVRLLSELAVTRGRRVGHQGRSLAVVLLEACGVRTRPARNRSPQLHPLNDWGSDSPGWSRTPVVGGGEVSWSPVWLVGGGCCAADERGDALAGESEESRNLLHRHPLPVQSGGLSPPESGAGRLQAPDVLGEQPGDERELLAADDLPVGTSLQTAGADVGGAGGDVLGHPGDLLGGLHEVLQGQQRRVLRRGAGTPFGSLVAVPARLVAALTACHVSAQLLPVGAGSVVGASHPFGDRAVQRMLP